MNIMTEHRMNKMNDMNIKNMKNIDINANMKVNMMMKNINMNVETDHNCLHHHVDSTTNINMFLCIAA